MRTPSTFRLELRFVIIPVEGGDVERTRLSARSAVAEIGTVVDANAKPYGSPARSFAVRVEADCAGDHRRIVESVVKTIGGGGWTVSGEDDVIEAMWSPRKAAMPPLGAFIIWAHLQTIPMKALPSTRRASTA
jgi:hypothetical protein